MQQQSKEQLPFGAGLSKQERETVITYHEGGDTLTIATASPVMLRRLEKLAATYGATVEIRSPWQARVELPIRALSFRNYRAPIEMSDEERARRGKILAEARTSGNHGSGHKR